MKKSINSFYKNKFNKQKREIKWNKTLERVVVATGLRP